MDLYTYSAKLATYFRYPSSSSEAALFEGFVPRLCPGVIFMRWWKWKPQWHSPAKIRDLWWEDIIWWWGELLSHSGLHLVDSWSCLLCGSSLGFKERTTSVIVGSKVYEPWGAPWRKIMLNVFTALNACSLTVDKCKSRTSSRNQQPPTNGQPDLVPPESKSRNVEYYKALCEKKNQTIQQLENTLRSNNRRFEAFAVVIKHLYAGVSIMRLYCLCWWIILLYSRHE